MKKLSVYAFGAGIIFIAASFYYSRQTEIINIHSSGTSVVSFGDSLVSGVGATSGNDFSYLLSARLGNMFIVNLGKSGDTTVSALARIEAIWEHDPKVVIVLLGGNDYLRHVPMDETFSNLGVIVDKIHEHGSAVLLLGVRGGLLRDTYNSRFKEFAKEKRVGFVPNVLDDIIGNKELMSDSIHPNDIGYNMIANKVAPVLKKMLAENVRK